MPHFQVVLGGKFRDNAGEYGVAIGAVPSKRIPQAVLAITEYFVRGRHKGESFQAFVSRIGKKEIKGLLEHLTKIPSHEIDPSYYSDWGDPREFTLVDMGVGECAGEVVSQAEFTLAASERELFEAHLLLDGGLPQNAAKAAYASMLRAAQGLVKSQNPAISENENQIINEFTNRFVDTQLFWDKYAGGKFAEYFSKPGSLSVRRKRRMPIAPFNCCRRHSCLSMPRTTATTKSVVVWPVRLSWTMWRKRTVDRKKWYCKRSP